MEMETNERKNTKERLNELQDLWQAGYLTDNEFHIARVNALREEGIDIVIHTRMSDSQHLREEEEEEESRGCGCFLAGILLTVALALGVVLALPGWPDRAGGVYVRAARQWILNRGAGLFSIFSSEEPASPMPDPVPSVPLPATIVVIENEKDARQGLASSALSSDFSSDLSFDLFLPVPSSPKDTPSMPLSPDVAPEPAAIAPVLPEPEAAPFANSVLPPLDARIFSLPDTMDVASLPASQEPEVTIVEILPSFVEVVSNSLQESPRREGQGEGQGERGEGRRSEGRRSEGRRSEGGEQGLQRGFISVRSVRIRSAPDTSTNDNVIGWGRNGDRVLILEKSRSRDGSGWYRVRYEDGSKQGWVSGSLVTLED